MLVLVFGPKINLRRPVLADTNGHKQVWRMTRGENSQIKILETMEIYGLSGIDDDIETNR